MFQLVCETASLEFAEIDPPMTGNIVINPEYYPIDPFYASVFSDVIKINNKRVYLRIGFTITNAACGAWTQIGVSYGRIDGTATKLLIDKGEKPVRDNDSTVVTMSGVLNGNPALFPIEIKINYCGQDKVKGL